MLVKGGDYRREEVVGREFVEADGGEVILVDLVPGHSTTSILSRSERASDPDKALRASSPPPRASANGAEQCGLPHVAGRFGRRCARRGWGGGGLAGCGGSKRKCTVAHDVNEKNHSLAARGRRRAPACGRCRATRCRSSFCRWSASARPISRRSPGG